MAANDVLASKRPGLKEVIAKTKAKLSAFDKKCTDKYGEKYSLVKNALTTAAWGAAFGIASTIGAPAMAAVATASFANQAYKIYKDFKIQKAKLAAETEGKQTLTFKDYAKNNKLRIAGATLSAATVVVSGLSAAGVAVGTAVMSAKSTAGIGLALAGATQQASMAIKQVREQNKNLPKNQQKSVLWAGIKAYATSAVMFYLSMRAGQEAGEMAQSMGVGAGMAGVDYSNTDNPTYDNTNDNTNSTPTPTQTLDSLGRDMQNTDSLSVRTGTPNVNMPGVSIDDGFSATNDTNVGGNIADNMKSGGLFGGLWNPEGENSNLPPNGVEDVQDVSNSTPDIPAVQTEQQEFWSDRADKFLGEDIKNNLYSRIDSGEIKLPEGIETKEEFAYKLAMAMEQSPAYVAEALGVDMVSSNAFEAKIPEMTAEQFGKLGDLLNDYSDKGNYIGDKPFETTNINQNNTINANQNHTGSEQQPTVPGNQEQQQAQVLQAQVVDAPVVGIDIVQPSVDDQWLPGTNPNDFVERLHNLATEARNNGVNPDNKIDVPGIDYKIHATDYDGNPLDPKIQQNMINIAETYSRRLDAMVENGYGTRQELVTLSGTVERYLIGDEEFRITRDGYSGEISIFAADENGNTNITMKADGTFETRTINADGSDVKIVHQDAQGNVYDPDGQGQVNQEQQQAQVLQAQVVDAPVVGIDIVQPSVDDQWLSGSNPNEFVERLHNLATEARNNGVEIDNSGLADTPKIDYEVYETDSQGNPLDPNVQQKMIDIAKTYERRLDAMVEHGYGTREHFEAQGVSIDRYTIGNDVFEISRDTGAMVDGSTTILHTDENGVTSATHLRADGSTVTAISNREGVTTSTLLGLEDSVNESDNGIVQDDTLRTTPEIVVENSGSEYKAPEYTSEDIKALFPEMQKNPDGTINYGPYENLSGKEYVEKLGVVKHEITDILRNDAKYMQMIAEGKDVSELTPQEKQFFMEHQAKLEQYDLVRSDDGKLIPADTSNEQGQNQSEITKEPVYDKTDDTLRTTPEIVVENSGSEYKAPEYTSEDIKALFPEMQKNPDGTINYGPYENLSGKEYVEKLGVVKHEITDILRNDAKYMQMIAEGKDVSELTPQEKQFFMEHQAKLEQYDLVRSDDGKLIPADTSNEQGQNQSDKHIENSKLSPETNSQEIDLSSTRTVRELKSNLSGMECDIRITDGNGTVIFAEHASAGPLLQSTEFELLPDKALLSTNNIERMEAETQLRQIWAEHSLYEDILAKENPTAGEQAFISQHEEGMKNMGITRADNGTLVRADSLDYNHKAENGVVYECTKGGVEIVKDGGLTEIEAQDKAYQDIKGRGEEGYRLNALEKEFMRNHEETLKEQHMYHDPKGNLVKVPDDVYVTRDGAAYRINASIVAENNAYGLNQQDYLADARDLLGKGAKATDQMAVKSFLMNDDIYNSLKIRAEAGETFSASEQSAIAGFMENHEKAETIMSEKYGIVRGHDGEMYKSSEQVNSPSRNVDMSKSRSGGR